MKKTTSPIPVTLVSGFLGSGKTTLMNRILNGDHGLKIAVMVNDFGEINIDSQLIVSAEQSMVNLANGCICCTVESDLIEQLHKILKLRDRPEYILIETSGVSDPSKVVNTLRYPQFRQQLSVDAVISMLDADQFSSLEGDMKTLAMDQLAVADMVVINKTDLASEDQLQQLREQWLFPRARVFETQFADVPLELLLGTDLGGQETPGAESEGTHNCSEDCDHEHHHAAHDQLFSTFSWQSDKPLSVAKLRQMLKALPTGVYRAKGFVHLAEVPDQRCTLHLVGSRIDIEKAGPWPGEAGNQLIMIGRPPLDAAELTAQLQGCCA